MLGALVLPLLLANPYSDTSMGVVRGGDLINRCQESSPESGSFCFAYITGVFDSVRAYETWLNMHEFCVPGGTTQADMRDAVIAYIEKNPDDRLGQGASVVVRALKQRFPCAPEAMPSKP